MHIIVCVKQIYDPEVATSVFKVDESKNAVVPIPGMQLVMSPFDEQAVEAALRIRDQMSGEVKITVMTFGGASAKEVLKQGLSMGADEGVHVVNASQNDTDSYTTALSLCKAIEKCGDVNLVLTGRQAADLDAGVVGCGIGELLGIPVINWAKRIDTDGQKVTVERVLDDGVETVETDLPALVTVSNELGEPRKPSLRETMKAARKPVAQWTMEDVGVSVQSGGLNRQKVQRLYIPVKEGRCQFIEGANAHEIAANLVKELQVAKIL